jgi:hypothetical protein
LDLSIILVLVNIKSVTEYLMLLTSSLGVSSSKFITKLNSLQLVIWLYISEESREESKLDPIRLRNNFIKRIQS